MLSAIIITACLSFLVGCLVGLWWASSSQTPGTGMSPADQAEFDGYCAQNEALAEKLKKFDEQRTTYWADGILKDGRPGLQEPLK